VRVEGKGEVVGFGTDRAFLLSLSAGGTLPTGDASAFLGEKTFTGRARALLEYQRGENLRAVAMVGGLFREKSVFLGTPESHSALYGLAAELKPTDEIGVLAEVTGRVASKYYDTNPAEFDAAMRFYLPSMLNLLMGAGFGLNHGIGSPVVRAYVGLGWAPDYRDRDHDGVPDVSDRCPDEPEDRDGFQDDDGCPDPDNDGDGIPDALDKCPNEPEDFDGFQDDDGCPDLDNDGDGIPDLKDACPNEKEDGKGKRPTDGCPSTSEDSDGDGIPDPTDKCPDEPEDKDGFQDDDGCPDYDNDGDGIPDAYDACPNEPEDLDGFEDNDGCPDPDNDHDGIPTCSTSARISPRPSTTSRTTTVVPTVRPGFAGRDRRQARHGRAHQFLPGARRQAISSPPTATCWLAWWRACSRATSRWPRFASTCMARTQQGRDPRARRGGSERTGQKRRRCATAQGRGARAWPEPRRVHHRKPGQAQALPCADSWGRTRRGCAGTAPATPAAEPPAALPIQEVR
jgi:hypothetical protein